ncbi:hypothetical protein DSM00_3078 [Leeuwenhoekiella aequorea]|uniref:Uncharacterized protein n=1 Tax=Leeuwenhoekiella aequorea TaxID=283736 RepID=A0A4Q0P1H8_9FLAO|nr:hypothetical protein [uncultured bacterium]RXG20277.1 hypothetical protein DSM00_3078 [Leeuwenhoekiella aequorea]
MDRTIMDIPLSCSVFISIFLGVNYFQVDPFYIFYAEFFSSLKSHRISVVKFLDL